MIECKYNKQEINHQTNVYIDKNQKKILLDKKPINKLSNLIGNLCCVMFSPEDLRLSKGGPQERRKFMDRCMSQILPSYFYNLSVYDKNLKMRNAELKKGGANLDIWDIGLAKAAVVIYKHRITFVNRLQKAVTPILKSIVKNEEIELVYQVPSSLVDEEKYIEALHQTKERDLRNITTSIGPHRDDILIKINGKEVRQFGSQGQQRTAALCLKLAELQIMTEVLDDSPILLLDDVMSELDINRQRHLIEMIGGIQSFITTTQVDFEITGKQFAIHGGKIKER